MPLEFSMINPFVGLAGSDGTAAHLLTPHQRFHQIGQRYHIQHCQYDNGQDEPGTTATALAPSFGGLNLRGNGLKVDLHPRCTRAGERKPARCGAWRAEIIVQGRWRTPKYTGLRRAKRVAAGRHRWRRSGRPGLGSAWPWHAAEQVSHRILVEGIGGGRSGFGCRCRFVERVRRRKRIGAARRAESTAATKGVDAASVEQVVGATKR